MKSTSERINRFKPSLTVKISQKAREMRLSGKNVISLSSGEPDFDTPNHIKKEAIKSINAGFTKYTQVDGIPELKESIVRKFIYENNIKYEQNQISVGVGGKHVIYNLFMSSINHGDEVIIPAPYWVSYPDIVSLCGGQPKTIETKIEDGFKITPELLKEKITKKTKWLIINSPCNPTGTVYSKKELKEISKVLIDHSWVKILSDDIYEHILYGQSEFSNIINVEPRLYERTFIVNGVSKAFSMTGWRIGYGAGDPALIESISKIQSQSTTNPCSISQIAAKHALDSNKDFLEEWIRKFEQRKEYLINFFQSIKEFKTFIPDGAFYLFISCEGFLYKSDHKGFLVKSDVDFAEYLLTDAGVAVVPGIAFGMSPYFRISYATSLEKLKKACNLIEKSVDKLK